MKLEVLAQYGVLGCSPIFTEVTHTGGDGSILYTTSCAVIFHQNMVRWEEGGGDVVFLKKNGEWVGGFFPSEGR